MAVRQPEIVFVHFTFYNNPRLGEEGGRAMVYAFDTLGYAKRLCDGGVSEEQAEAHAEAARDFIMAELFTKADSIGLRQDIDGRFVALDASFAAFKQYVDARFLVIESKIDTLGLRLTVRLGAMLAAGIALLAALQKLS